MPPAKMSKSSAFEILFLGEIIVKDIVPDCETYSMGPRYRTVNI